MSARQSKPAAELVAGDRIHTTAAMGFGFADQTHEVRYVEPTGPADTDMVVVMVAGGRTFEAFPDVRIDLVTDAELAEAEVAERRETFARELRQLADRMVDLKLPVARYMGGVSLGVLDSRADLERWAEVLGAKIRGGTPADPIPALDCRTDGGLDIHAQTHPVDSTAQAMWPATGVPSDADVDIHDASKPLLPIAPKVDPALRDYGDGTGDPVPDGVDGYAPTSPGRVAEPQPEPVQADPNQKWIDRAVADGKLERKAQETARDKAMRAVPELVLLDELDAETPVGGAA